MASKYPLVVYGISGYTGKIIAEYLTREGIPFVAAGRSRDRIEAELKKVPGNHVVDIVACEHTEAALTKLFEGAQVVANVVGPFGQLAEPVIKAALANKCHYLDTTGEPDYTLMLRDTYGDQFAANNTVAISACAAMWVTGMVAAEVALETPGIDSLDILYAPRGNPTPASTLSFLRMCCLPQLYKEDGVMKQWDPLAKFDVFVPGNHQIQAAVPWGGGFEPIWFENDSRVRNCKVTVSFTSREVVNLVHGRIVEYHELAKTRTAAEMEEITNAWGRAMSPDPDALIKEDPSIQRCMISVFARGNTVGKHLAFYGTSGYLQTGFLIAEACRRILIGRLKKVGYQPATAAFGHRELISAMQEAGLWCLEPVGY